MYRESLKPKYEVYINRNYCDNPFFKADSITGDIIIDQSATISWNIPSWYPIKRYLQYTLGILGSTPNIVSDYSKLHPDYEEE
jgi:hypothetical protein